MKSLKLKYSVLKKIKFEDDHGDDNDYESDN